MKAIGCVIAYFKNHNNYGTSLQGFATIKAIEHEGYKCRLIQYQKSDSLFKKIRLNSEEEIVEAVDQYIESISFPLK